MATTPQQVFDIAMSLMDQVDETTGATDTTDNKEFKNRTLLILNALKGELYPYSDTCVATAGKRSVHAYISDFSTPLDLDDFLAQSVMPYGLAAHLLLDENPATASALQSKYDSLIQELGNAIPAASEDITDLYGGLVGPAGNDAYGW